MKHRKLDRLPRDALAARAAGLTYGKWKAGYPPVLLPPADESQKLCVTCGKPVKVVGMGTGDRRRKHCLDCTGR